MSCSILASVGLGGQGPAYRERTAVRPGRASLDAGRLLVPVSLDHGQQPAPTGGNPAAKGQKAEPSPRASPVRGRRSRLAGLGSPPGMGEPVLAPASGARAPVQNGGGPRLIRKDRPWATAAIVQRFALGVVSPDPHEPVLLTRPCKRCHRAGDTSTVGPAVSLLEVTQYRSGISDGGAGAGHRSSWRTSRRC